VSRSHRPPLVGETARRRILLTGATGQVGHELLGALRPIGDVLAPGRIAHAGLPALDLSRPESIRSAVRNLRPHLIVNAGAYTAVDKAEEETKQAMAVNGVAPGILAEEAQRLGAGLVHYSTDYVFDGSGTQAWREDNPTAPLNAYGRSKLAGEQAIRDVGPPHLILRTSWVHGVHGANFVKTMLRLAAERTALRVVNDQIGGPTSARVIADVTSRLLAQAVPDFAGFLQARGGMFHLACGGETSWYDFALEILRRAKARGKILAVQDVTPVTSDDYPTAARRPRNSRLDCGRLSRQFGIVPPDWKSALEHTLGGIIETGQRPGEPSHLGSQCTQQSRTQVRAMEPTALAVADLDVGVIYTHERDWMPRLLPSLSRSADDFSLQLILVDNVSHDGTEEWETLLPRTTVLRNTQRLGYAPNLNRILEAATAPFVLLLNTDMEFDPEEQCLAKMVRFMQRHPRCGLSGCRLYHPDGTYGYPARRFQTLSVIAGRRTPLAPLLQRVVDRYQYHERPYTGIFPCDWLSGCFMLIRRAAYEQVGGFDCRFAKYFEDVDMCLRMAQAGWQVLFNGETYCYHGEQRASRKLLSRDTVQHVRSYYHWLRKWGWSPGKASASRAVA
jgi:dTDP-4-dehydrorhamnose reductase